MDLSNIFMSNEECNNSDISGKLTYTSILESIPENKLSEPLNNWESKYRTEWRWRFLKINYQHTKTMNIVERYVVEISYMKRDHKRYYFNRFGEWVERYVDPFYDQFIEKVYYVYNK